MAQDAWRAYLELAYGATEATRKKATKTVRRLVGKSALTAEQLQTMAEDLLSTSTANRESLTKLVRYELDRALGAVGLATADEVTALTARVRELEGQLRAVAPEPVGGSLPVGAELPAEPPPVAKKAVAKKTVAKKAIARKVTGPVGAEVSPVPAPAPVAEPAAAEPLAPRAAKRAPVKQAPVKQTAAKKSGPAKKAAAKAAVAKIAEASDVEPVKAPAKKATPRKRTGA